LNSRQLQYAVLLSQVGNFSQVALALNITQPALSKQILSLEKELGLQLFDRSVNPIALTAAGEYFIKEAKELLYKEDQLIRSMEQFKTGDKGNLDIGTTYFRSAYLLPRLTKMLREKYPGVKVKLHEAGSDVIRKEAAEGKYDFAVINLPADESLFDITLIEPDCLVLVVSEEIATEHNLKTEDDGIFFADCKELPFVVVGETQEMRILFDKLCVSNNFYPNIVSEVVGLTTVWEMVRCGVGAALLPLQFVKNELTNENLKVVKIKDKTTLRQPAIITKKGQYLSEFAKYAIELLKAD